MRIRHKPWAREYLQTLGFFKTVEDFDYAALPHDRYSKVALEIGVGKGDYLLLMAQKHPEIFFIGVELNASVLSLAAQKLSEANVANVVIIHGDALILLPKIPKSSVPLIILNHSDPWPKKRHEKRRLTAPRFVDEYFKLLALGGKLIFKSDNDDFSRYSFDVFTNYTFSSVTFDQDYDGNDDFDAQTEYERKFRAKDVKIKRIIAVK